MDEIRSRFFRGSEIAQNNQGLGKGGISLAIRSRAQADQSLQRTTFRASADCASLCGHGAWALPIHSPVPVTACIKQQWRVFSLAAPCRACNQNEYPRFGKNLHIWTSQNNFHPDWASKRSGRNSWAAVQADCSIVCEMKRFADIRGRDGTSTT